ncbi:CCAAT-binding factor MAK21 family protein [Cryptosporidium ubiquitum]|uniref:CCAAT-binding factor MAK21 family protein n=1 Tax=Cryptosporidium ubiquitum TaxID=857276 RepID=A0A1J4MLF9_9CRYT|nr:CCAAT-binding factor MAK21 family protein [Cryptosporidium ubiquitum]OII74291.1 CCAAT-binding factor MAK21 family protein [Cryptosporidium ubiquitum]
MARFTQTTEKLNMVSKSKKVKLEMVTKILIDLNKKISEVKKIAMEPIPIDMLTMGNIEHLSLNLTQELTNNGNVNIDANGSLSLLKSLIHEFLGLSSIIMDNSSMNAENILLNIELSKCISSNRNKLRAIIVQIFMKWLKDDIMIRNYKNMKEKGNFVENFNFPISLSTFIIRSILTSSIQKDEINRIILDSKNNMSNDTFIMENLLLNEYIMNFKDLRYFFLRNILNLLNKCSEGIVSNFDHGKNSNIISDINNEKVNLMTTILLRVYHILINLPVPNENQLCENDHSNINKADLLFNSDFDGDLDKIAKFEKNYKTLYQKLWLKYINLVITDYDYENKIIPLPILKDALEYVSEFVMPIISNPLELADIFKNCFDGVSSKINPMDKLAISVISLNGLFYLIVNNRLNESSHLESDSEENISSGYYRRLYEILCPPIFSLKFRTKFLKLLSISLFSPLIPMAVLSCFIKKLIRISLFTSINNTVWIIALVNSLIKKHRNILFPILSLNEGDEIYEYVDRILKSTQGELWSYDKGLNVYKNDQFLDSYESSVNKSEEHKMNKADNMNINSEMGTYLSSNFGLWELYVHNKSVIPVIRHVSNTLTLNASNAKVNYHLHNLNYEDLIGLNIEEILVHEISSSNGIIYNYSTFFKKDKEKKANIPYNYIDCSSLSSKNLSQISNKFFTDSDVELFSLI